MHMFFLLSLALPTLTESLHHHAEQADGNFLSVKELIKRLFFKQTKDEPLNKEFQKCFLMCYRSFLASRQLLDALKERYPFLWTIIMSKQKRGVENLTLVYL